MPYQPIPLSAASPLRDIGRWYFTATVATTSPGVDITSERIAQCVRVARALARARYGTHTNGLEIRPVIILHDDDGGGVITLYHANTSPESIARELWTLDVPLEENVTLHALSVGSPVHPARFTERLASLLSDCPSQPIPVMPLRQREPIARAQHEMLDDVRADTILPSMRTVNVAYIVGPIVAPPPHPAFVDNVRTFGVLQPVILRESSVRDQYELIAGRRRVQAARMLEFPTISAVVWPHGTPVSRMHGMTISENNQRRANYIADMTAIEGLIATGIDIDEVASRLSLAPAVVRQRLALAPLSATMRRRAVEGSLPVALYGIVARMTPTMQTSLHQMTDGRTITRADVRAVRMVDGEEQLAIDGTDELSLLLGRADELIVDDADRFISGLGPVAHTALREALARSFAEAVDRATTHGLSLGIERIAQDFVLAPSARLRSLHVEAYMADGRIVLEHNMDENVSDTGEITPIGAIVVGFNPAPQRDTGALTPVVAPGARPDRTRDRPDANDDPEETGLVPRFVDGQRWSDDTVTEDGNESWERVIAHLESALRAIPLAAADASDRMFQAIMTVRVQATEAQRVDEQGERLETPEARARRSVAESTARRTVAERQTPSVPDAQRTRRPPRRTRAQTPGEGVAIAEERTAQHTGRARTPGATLRPDARARLANEHPTPTPPPPPVSSANAGRVRAAPLQGSTVRGTIIDEVGRMSANHFANAAQIARSAEAPRANIAALGEVPASPTSEQLLNEMRALTDTSRRRRT